MKPTVLTSYGRRYRLRTLVETGLDEGRGSGMGCRFPRYTILDYQPKNVASAQARGFDARCGDSGELLPDLLAELDGPALFWLDAHGIDCNRVPVADAFPGWEALPLLRELEAIAAWKHAARSVVLIDDMPVMAHWVGVGLGQGPDGVAFDGFLDDLPVTWKRSTSRGIMRLVPA